MAIPVFAQTGALCRQLVFEGEAKQGFEWNASIGHPASGNAAEWLVRLVPEGTGMPGGVIDRHSFSRGWTLAVSPADDQDYPDALLLASPPYGSLNSREIATTYGMRAQDAVAWSPRHFHFLTSPAALTRARRHYRALLALNSTALSRRQASAQLLALSGDAAAIASGRLDLLDAHLVSGSADPAPFAAQWAASFDRIPHSLDPSHNSGEKPSPQGELHSLHFKVTLWLPATWKAPPGSEAMPVKCSE